jgi:hypothetical protein
MAVVQKKTRIPAQQQGVDVVTLTIDIPAGADQSAAFLFERAFAAVPKCIGIVRQDSTGLDVACVPSLASMLAAGGTLRQKGTSTVIMTYNVTFVGDYINPTAY